MSSPVFPRIQYSPAREDSRPASPLALPPAGPVWWPSVMGTGILGSLLQLHGGAGSVFSALALASTCLSWLLMIGLTLAFTWRCLRRPGTFRETCSNPAIACMWSTVGMGVLSVGSATFAVIPARWPGFADAALAAGVVLWAIGTFITVITAFLFGYRMVFAVPGTPLMVWGLGVVAPVVSSTTGANLIESLGSGGQAAVLLVTYSCFCLSLFLGIPVFTRLYRYFLGEKPLGLAAAASAWVPLGVVGQSVAAAHNIAFHSRHMFGPEYAGTLQAAATIYGWAVFLVGIPLVTWAWLVSVRGFRRRMPFNPGWWALTFPVGTLALGATFHARATGLEVFSWLGLVGTLALVGTVTLCLVASAAAIIDAGKRGIAASAR